LEGGRCRAGDPASRVQLDPGRVPEAAAEEHCADPQSPALGHEGLQATGLPGGNFDQIIESIDRRLFSLPDELLVLPGHGLDTTLDTERPHLQEWIDRGW